jgi:branched-chain amino acid transport system ATP-binding protein
MLPAPWSILATGLGALIVLLVAPGGVAGWLLRVRDRLAYALVGRRDTYGVPEPDVAGGAPAAPSAPAAAPAVAPLLEVEGLRAGYGDLVVVHGVDLQVAPGEVVALLGGNGAGKTTTLRALTGVLAPVGGRVRFDGQDLTGAPAERVAAAGCTQVPGGEGVFPGLSVRENLRIGGWLIRGDDARLAEREAAALEAFPALAGRLEEPAANLSGGQQQMLALAMALMSEPKLLVIDELSLGLAPLVVGQLAAMVRAVAESGTAVLLVEQSLNVALTMAHRAVFLEHGTVRFSGPAHEMATRDDLLREVFLAGGGEAAPVPATVPAVPASPTPTTDPPPADALEAVDLVRRFGGIEAVSHVSFWVGAGEIVGLIGQNGAGKTTVVDLVSGYQRADHGVVRLAGRDVTEVPARRRFAHGLGRTFQGGRLFPGLTVDEAIAVGLEQSLVSRSLLDAAFRLPAWADTEAAVATRVDELVDTFALGAHRDHFVADLSTGTRRVVELATAVAHQPTLLLLDEPAAGLAQPEVESLVGLLRRIRGELGCAILLIEHDMPLVAAVSDRLVALESGSVIAEGMPAEVLADPLVVASYLGSDGAAVARSGAGGPPIAASSAQEGRS